MDQKMVVAGGKITAFLLFFCAMLVIPIGLGMCFSYPDSIWLVGPALLICGGIFISNGISNFRRSSRMELHSDEKMREIALKLRNIGGQISSGNGLLRQEASAGEVNILARWTYTTNEWKQFIAGETKTRSLNTTFEAILIVVLGGLFVQLARGAGWGLSFGISAFIAAIYWLGKFFMSMASIGKAAGKPNEVVIIQDAVIINGKYNAFRSELYRLKDVTLHESSTPVILEIVYQWQTRKGLSHDEIRIPVPEGSLEEARTIAATLW